jgi:cytochrome c oxidase cbb3-type subunit 2
MIKKLNTDALFVFVGALVFFLIGAVMTTYLPQVTETSWKKPAGNLRPYTESELRGKAIYQREGCWYCHTQQIRTLEADTKRYGWRGVDAPISLPGEYTRDTPHMLGTRRIGPDLARVGGKYDSSWHKTHFKNPRDLVPGSVMPPFPWLLTERNGEALKDIIAYLQTLGRGRNWRPDDDYEK